MPCAAIRDWVVEETGIPPKRRKPKGHKHDKLRLLRLADIEEKLKDMPAKVAEYRVRFPNQHWRSATSASDSSTLFYGSLIPPLSRCRSLAS